MLLLLHTVVECICLLTVTQSDGTTAALGTNTTSAFGPFGLPAGSADANYYVKLAVRVFDNYGSFCVYNITPSVQVTCVCIITPDVQVTCVCISSDNCCYSLLCVSSAMRPLCFTKVYFVFIIASSEKSAHEQYMQQQYVIPLGCDRVSSLAQSWGTGFNSQQRSTCSRLTKSVILLR